MTFCKTILSITDLIVTLRKRHSAQALSVIMLSVAFSYCYAQCRSAECRGAACMHIQFSDSSLQELLSIVYTNIFCTKQ